MIGAALLAIGSVALWQGQPYLFDWDELIYASLARHMVVTGDWLSLVINGDPFWEKPPFFFWLQAISFSLLGFSEGAARLPNALSHGGLVVGLVWMGYQIHSLRLGLIWSLVVSTSLLPSLFAKTGLIDPTFNLAMLIGLGGLFAYEQALLAGRSRSLIPLSISGLALGLAVLIKGPLGWGLPVIIWILYKLWHRTHWHGRDLVWFGLLSGGIASSWFVIEVIVNGPDFVTEFVHYQWRILSTDDGHHGPIYFHIVAYSLGCYPFAALSGVEIWSQVQPQLRSRLQAIRSGRTLQADHSPLSVEPLQSITANQTLDQCNHFMMMAVAVVLVLFSIIVQTKLIHYSSLLYVMGAYFASQRILRWLDGQAQPHWIEYGWIACSGLLLGGVLLLIPWMGQHLDQVIPLIDDPLTRSYLQTAVTWPWWTYSPGLIFLLGLIVGLIGCSRQWVQSSLCLVLATWLSSQLCWSWMGSRVLSYTQGGAITFFETMATESTVDAQLAPTVGLFGFRSFVPYFYGPLRVPWAMDLEDLKLMLEQEPTLNYLVTWTPFEAELLATAVKESIALVPVAREGGYVLLQIR